MIATTTKTLRDLELEFDDMLIPIGKTEIETADKFRVKLINRRNGHRSLDAFRI